MIVVLSDEQLERIEDALQSAIDIFVGVPTDEELLASELDDALKIVRAARAMIAA